MGDAGRVSEGEREAAAGGEEQRDCARADGGARRSVLAAAASRSLVGLGRQERQRAEEAAVGGSGASGAWSPHLGENVYSVVPAAGSVGRKSQHSMVKPELALAEKRPTPPADAPAGMAGRMR